MVKERVNQRTPEMSISRNINSSHIAGIRPDSNAPRNGSGVPYALV